MQHRLYHELVSWYALVDPPDDHRDEGLAFRAAFERVVTPAPVTLLELGSGAGHTALHMKHHFTCTLVDPSEAMLTRSRDLNPECRHVQGDMRSVQLDEQFDAVLIHDAIMYMVNEQELRAALTTAFQHTRPGGALIVAPDCTRDTFHEGSTLEHGAQGERSVQLMMYDWLPEPDGDAFVTEFVLLLRDGKNVSTVHESHLQGLFTQARWFELLAEVGYQVELLERPIGEGESDEIFLCIRPQ